ncbi:DUF4262 domain-containing protein [Actinoplanes sp. NPDC051346]|uniref:DUF4262 domain-containing protein n=1 Tax=Actinoplanes sp. NPDC051346 TaxID=3155048 RepID=UPI00343D132C
MDDQPCHCLLCQVPLAEESWDQRDRGIADNIRRFGWNVNGVSGGSTPDWAYSIGIWHTLRSPEVCVFGLPAQTAMNIVNVVGELLREGERVRDGQRRDDVLNGYDVVLRAVEPRWYGQFFGAGIDFYQRPPMPMVQIIWPDRDRRFPWDPDVDGQCRQSQPSLWLRPEDHPPGRWAEHDPYAGWPFRTSLPYSMAHASAGVASGTAAISTVLREDDGTWWFLEADADRDATEQVTLRQVADTHPDVVTVADLRPGERAGRDQDGTWRR